MKRFVAIIFVMAFMFVFMSGSFAKAEGETPHVHYYHLAETIDHGQCGFYYYSVNSCQYALYQHNHFRNKFMKEYIYRCVICNDEYSDYQYTIGWDGPEGCTVHDWGK